MCALSRPSSLDAWCTAALGRVARFPHCTSLWMTLLRSFYAPLRPEERRREEGRKRREGEGRDERERRERERENHHHGHSSTATDCNDGHSSTATDCNDGWSTATDCNNDGSTATVSTSKHGYGENRCMLQVWEEGGVCHRFTNTHNWSPGLILCAFYTIFSSLTRLKGVLGPSLAGKRTKTETQIYILVS